MEQHHQFNPAKEIADFSSTFVVSEERDKKYLDHLKHLNFSKDFEIKQPLRSYETENQDYSWEELLLSGGLKSLYVFELDSHLKKHSPP